MTYKERARLGLLQAEAGLKLAVRRLEAAQLDLDDASAERPDEDREALRRALDAAKNEYRLASFRHGLWALTATILGR